MNEKEILYQAILKAEKNGYKGYLIYLPLIFKHIKNLNILFRHFFWRKRIDIIFSHSFAKSFFGNSDSIYYKDAWKRRLEEMSNSNNEIKYLEKFL